MAIRNDLGIDGQVPMAVDAAYAGILPPADPAAIGAAIRVAQNEASTPPVVITIALEDGNIARLPADTDITNVRANGADLEFVQPDGSVIVVTGGAIATLMLFVGDIQIPAEAVELMFTSNGIEPAAGPEGGEPDGTGSYVDLGTQNVGDGFRQNSLLGDTGFGFGSGPGFTQQTNNTVPDFPEGGIFVRLSEEGLDDGNPDNDFLPDDQTDQVKVFNVPFGLVDAEGNDLTYTIRGIPPGSFTSGGVAITWVLSPDGTSLVGSAGLTTIIEVSFDNAAHTYTITLSGPLDHLDPNSEDTLDLVLPIRVADYQNFSDSTLTLTIEDDAPIQSGKPAKLLVDEDDIDTQGGSRGSQPNDGPIPDGSTTGDPGVDQGGPATATGSLAVAVKAGADGGLTYGFLTDDAVRTFMELQALKSEGELLSYQVVGNTLYGFANLAGAGGLIYNQGQDRLVFTLDVVKETGSYTFKLWDQLDHDKQGQGETLPIYFGGALQAWDYDKDAVLLTDPVTLKDMVVVTITDDVPKAVADTDSVIEGLTATGNVITDASTGDQGDGDNGADTVGADDPIAVSRFVAGTPGGDVIDGTPGSAAAGQPVIGLYGTLTILANGNYTYVAKPNLDNASPVTDTFTYTIVDRDGDLSTTTLTVRIADGAGPLAGTGAVIPLDEEGLGTVNSTGSNSSSNVERNSGSITFQAGSDNIVSLAFTSIAGITANVNGVGGPDVVWTLVSASQITGAINGITAITIDLTATLPILAGTAGFATVTVTLSDNFPHPNGNGQNVINLTGINVVATDTDGDVASAGVAINITDDVPTVVTGPGVWITVDEDDIDTNLSKGSDPNDGTGDGSTTGPAGQDTGGPATAVSGSLQGLVHTVTGADAPFTYGFTPNAVAYMVGLGLTSGGSPVSYVVSGNVLRGFANANGQIGVTYDPPNDVTLFEFTLNPTTGQYTFALYDQLDHLGDNGTSLPIDFGDALRAFDTDGDWTPLTKTVTVNITDDTPLATNESLTVNEGAAVSLDLDANDNFGADGKGNIVLGTVVVVAGAGSVAWPSPGNGSINTNGVFTITPPTDWFGTITVPYTIVDGDGDPATATATITVNPINDAPVITSGSAGSLPENTPNTTIVYDANATDVDNPVLTYSLASGGDNDKFNINSSTGEVTFKASPNFEAPTDTGGDNVYDITVRASDGTLTTTKAVAITVTDVNETPNAGADFAVNAAENVSDTTVLADVNANDPDSGGGNDNANANAFENLTYSIFADVSNKFEINATTGEVSLKAGQTLDFETAQQHVITVRTTDGGGLTDDVQVTINVTDVNAAPVITSGSTGTVAENSTIATVVYDTNATDDGENNNTLTYSLASGGDNDKFNINSSTGEVTFKASPNFEAPADTDANNVYDITVQASDGTLTTTKAVAITVTDVSEGPVPAPTLSDAIGAYYAFSKDATANNLSNPSEPKTISINLASLFAGLSPNATFTILGSSVNSDTLNFNQSIGASDWSWLSLINGTLSGNPTDAPDQSGSYMAKVVATDNGVETIAILQFSVLDGNATRYIKSNASTDTSHTDDLFVLSGGVSGLVQAGNGEDVVLGDLGDNKISGGGGRDAVYGGLGGDELQGDNERDYLVGGAGADTLDGGEHDDVLVGGADSDTLYGRNGNDWLFGGSGNDFLYGGGHNDHLYGGSGNDRLEGGDDSDWLYGEDGDDILIGGAHLDEIYGGSGNDTLYTGSIGSSQWVGDGNKLDGGSGNDRLVDTTMGRDFLKGGEGGDTFAFQHVSNNLGEADLISDYVVGQDRIDLSSLLDGFFGANNIPSGSLNNYVRITDGGTDAQVRVDLSGSGNFSQANINNVAVLQGHGTIGTQITVFFEGIDHIILVS